MTAVVEPTPAQTTPAVGGRRLLLTVAARRVPAGRVLSIDIWHAEDQSGNRPTASLANAAAEGVRERVAVQTADMRHMPFADQTFDRVVSHWVVHNVEEPEGSAQALAEIARVLKPGGYVVLADIALHREYKERFAALGFSEIRHEVAPLWDLVRAAVSFGSFRPGVVVAHKPSTVQ